MRCGITGASGLLGGNLAIALLDGGHDVIAIRRSVRGTGHLEGFDIEWTDDACPRIRPARTTRPAWFRAHGMV